MRMSTFKVWLLGVVACALVFVGTEAQSQNMIQVKGSDSEVNLVQKLAEVFMQKNPGTEWARGGAWTLDKARLYMALDRVEKGNRAKIIDCKAFRNENPRGWTLTYKLVNGWKFISDGYWKPE